jgi:hypothetical protein
MRGSLMIIGTGACANQLRSTASRWGTRIAFSTVNRELAILRMLLRLAKRRKKIKVVPDFNLESEKSRKRKRVASDAEHKALLENMPRHHQRVLIALYESAMQWDGEAVPRR